MDTEIEPVLLVQAEAIDNLMGLRFITFDEKDTVVEGGDVVLHGVEEEDQVGTVRSFWDKIGNTGVVMFLVTMDYNSAERLLLEAGELAICVEYFVNKADGTTNEASVCLLRFGIRSVELARLPTSALASPNQLYLPLRPAKKWRWQ